MKGNLVRLEDGLRKRDARPRSWILMDSSGKEVVLDVDKYSFMNRLRIHARDLRILDPHLSYPTAILGRGSAIVLNLEHIKAIITPQEVFLGDPSEGDVLPVVKELRRRLMRGDAVREHDGNSRESRVKPAEAERSPFEFRALEVALESICTYLSARTTELEAAIYPALDTLTSKVSSRNMDRVRKLKSQMTRLTTRVQKLRDELEKLLDDEDAMADFYLSRKLSSSTLRSVSIGSKTSRASAAAAVCGYEKDVEELEMLFEAYFMQMGGTLNRLPMIREYSDSTEGYINIQLENHRNQLIQIELFLNTGTLCVTIFTLVAGLFGVNIPYSWNTGHAYLMKWVLLLTGVVCIFIFLAIISYARLKSIIRS